MQLVGLVRSRSRTSGPGRRRPALPASLRSTPCAMSGDCLPMAVQHGAGVAVEAHVASGRNRSRRIVLRTICSKSIMAFVVISPATMHHAGLRHRLARDAARSDPARGSRRGPRRRSGRAILSGWPSETDSDVNRYDLLIVPLPDVFRKKVSCLQPGSQSTLCSRRTAQRAPHLPNAPSSRHRRKQRSESSSDANRDVWPDAARYK